MEKRLKHFFGFLIVGLGLLFNLSFGAPDEYLFLEGVTLPLTSSNYNSSSNYLYKFTIYNGRTTVSSNVRNGLIYSLFYDGDVKFSYNTTFGKYDTDTNYTFNNSAFSGDYYSGRLNSSLCSSCDRTLVNQDGYYHPIKIAFGNGIDFGKNFVFSYDIASSVDRSPKYSLGNGFFSNGDYTLKTFSTVSNMNFARIFFNQNINLSSPLDSFDLVYSAGSNITGSVAWQFFDLNTTTYRTKYSNQNQYIIDYGREGKKGLHFGGYGMGYTFALDLSQDNYTFQWGNRTFSNIGSRCIESAMNLGITNFDTLTSNNCSSLGLLVLKGDSYVSRNNNASVIVLGKNPNNTKQILYEQFDCADDDLLRLMNDGSGDFCNSLSHGYIVHNGSGDVLPFSNKMDTYNLGSGNDFIDFMFNDGIYGSITITDNQYCLKSTSKQYCFGLHSTPQLSSLKELYLQAGGDLAGNGQTVTGNLIPDLIINQPESYYTYSGLVEYTMDGNFYVEEDVTYIENYTDYIFVNGVPQLKNLKFGVCPFNTNSDFASFGVKDFSFDMLVPHKCILAGLQAGYTSVNMSGYDHFNLPLKFIDSRLNNSNVALIGHFVAILFIFGISMLLFYFLKFFK